MTIDIERVLSEDDEETLILALTNDARDIETACIKATRIQTSCSALRALLREALERLEHAIGAIDTNYQENLEWLVIARRAVFGEEKK
jgi:hypothetical protein